MGWKPGQKSVEVETNIPEEIKERIAKSEPTKTRMPVSHGNPGMQPDHEPVKPSEVRPKPDEPQSMWPMLQDIRARVMTTETLLQTLVMQLNRIGDYKLATPAHRETPEEQVKRMAAIPGKVEVADLSPKQTKKLETAAQEVLANNKAKKPVVDIPSIDVITHALVLYIKKHGRGAAETRLAQYHVKRASEIPEEKRHLFLADIS